MADDSRLRLGRHGPRDPYQNHSDRFQLDFLLQHDHPLLKRRRDRSLPSPTCIGRDVTDGVIFSRARVEEECPVADAGLKPLLAG